MKADHLARVCPSQEADPRWVGLRRSSCALLDHLVIEHPERVERCEDGDAKGAR